MATSPFVTQPAMPMDRLKRLAQRAENGFRSHEAKEAMREIIRLRMQVHQMAGARQSCRRLRITVRKAMLQATTEQYGYVRLPVGVIKELNDQVGLGLNGNDPASTESDMI
jgi:hypothetical protein